MKLALKVALPLCLTVCTIQPAHSHDCPAFTSDTTVGEIQACMTEGKAMEQPPAGDGPVGDTDTAQMHDHSLDGHTGPLKLEAESVPLADGWRNRGDGSITWEGPDDDHYSLADRSDATNMIYQVPIRQAGDYRFIMRATVGKVYNPSQPPNDFGSRLVVMSGSRLGIQLTVNGRLTPLVNVDKPSHVS